MMLLHAVGAAFYTLLLAMVSAVSAACLSTHALKRQQNDMHPVYHASAAIGLAWLGGDIGRGHAQDASDTQDSL